MKASAFAMCLVLVSLVVACGGDDAKKTRQACTDDTVCGGGICFEQECYEACSETEPCAADDEVCVRKDEAGTEVDLCVVAADFFDAHADCVDAEADCADIVYGQCQAVACHEGKCLLDNVTDGLPCYPVDGQPDVCKAGHCGERTSVACDDPAGVWLGSVRRPEQQVQAECVVDGYVTHEMTLTLTAVDAGYTAGFHVTNVPDPASGTCSSMDGVYPETQWDASTRTLTLRMEGGPALCDGEPSGQNEVYTFVGVLSADCTTLEGTESKEPGDPCNPDTPPFELHESFTKQAGQSHAAFR